MSMSVEGVVAMQACARIGATHSVVFGGFSAQSLRDRIEGAGAVMVITADEQLRGGKQLPLKSIVDEAIALGGCECGEGRHRLPPHRRHRSPGTPSRDRWLHEETRGASRYLRARMGRAPSTRCSCSTPRGSTGKPKGVQHSTGGYLLHAALTHDSGPSTSSPTTCSGAPPTSAGSPATPTSPMARWRSARTEVVFEGVPDLPGCRAASGR